MGAWINELPVLFHIEEEYFSAGIGIVCTPFVFVFQIGGASHAFVSLNTTTTVVVAGTLWFAFSS